MRPFRVAGEGGKWWWLYDADMLGTPADDSRLLGSFQQLVAAAAAVGRQLGQLSLLAAPVLTDDSHDAFLPLTRQATG